MAVERHVLCKIPFYLVSRYCALFRCLFWLVYQANFALHLSCIFCTTLLAYHLSQVIIVWCCVLSIDLSRSVSCCKCKTALNVFRGSHMTLVVLTLSMVVQWLACIVTNVELRLSLDSFKFVDIYYFCSVFVVYCCYCYLVINVHYFIGESYIYGNLLYIFCGHWEVAHKHSTVCS